MSGYLHKISLLSSFLKMMSLLAGFGDHVKEDSSCTLITACGTREQKGRKVQMKKVAVQVKVYNTAFRITVTTCIGKGEGNESKKPNYRGEKRKGWLNANEYNLNHGHYLSLIKNKALHL